MWFVVRNMDPIDPVKYDFALFGLGVHESFSVQAFNSSIIIKIVSYFCSGFLTNTSL